MVKINYIEDILWLHWKKLPGDIVITLLDNFWKNSEWVAQGHAGYIVNHIVKETIM